MTQYKTKRTVPLGQNENRIATTHSGNNENEYKKSSERFGAE